MPSFSLQSLADLVEGEILGDSQVQISGALPQRDAVAGCITLADSPQQAVKANSTLAAAVVVNQASPHCVKPMLVVNNIHAAFTKIVAHFRPIPISRPRDNEIRIARTAVVDSTATIGKGTEIGERVIVGADCRIGERCLIHPGVTLMAQCTIGDDCEIYPGCVFYPQTKIGSRVLIHANAVMGAYGFGYRQNNGAHERTSQLGWVDLGDDVEIGAGTTIDRGTYGATRIGRGTKIDNQVQIGHNCHIGEHNLLCAQVGIAGSCTTGNYVVMGGQVGLADHLYIADRVMIGAQSGIIGNLAEGSVVVGTPAGPRRPKMIEYAIMAKLPEMRKELKAVMSRLEELEQQAATAPQLTLNDSMDGACNNESHRDAA
jgi:UDP-3-O-[3-hydroxymyristoyl] glucosamine N-acyltransferase